MQFKLNSKFKPAGDQPHAIERLTAGILSGKKHQTLLGVTGSGKTFTIASVIEKIQKPTLILSPNKTLAAQLYQEFKSFFPENSVNYFVSYYDYYQPEAYIPHTDTYIEKDAKINEIIDNMRHAATASILTRPDTIIVASVSCIYGIGDPEEYIKASLNLKTGQKISIKDLLNLLVKLQYHREYFDKKPGSFLLKGEILEIFTPSGNESIILEFNKNKIESIQKSKNTPTRSNITTSHVVILDEIKIFPAKHFVTPREKLNLAIKNIKSELKEQFEKFKKQGKILEAERLKAKTNLDLEMLKETSYCNGIENYSQQLSFRNAGDPPHTLIDYFPKDFLLVIDESHIATPQVRGMFNGDRARKETLVNHGFRLPSALDNRPLKFNEFNQKINQIVYVSATPADYEIEKSLKNNAPIIEQIIRPTNLLDPKITVKPSKNQIKDLIGEIKKQIKNKEKTLVTVITKRIAEDLADYLKAENIKANYIHSEIKTLERSAILRDLRLDKYDALIGVNLLREGLDLPEVSLIAILDADKEGFLRNETTLIQTIGRAARHINGRVIMYADKITDSMKKSIFETKRRRKIQEEFNQKNNIKPKGIEKEIFGEIIETNSIPANESMISIGGDKNEIIKSLEKEMKKAAKNLDFERAAHFKKIIENHNR